MVDEIIAIGTTGAGGFYLANLPANALENGSLTLLLVKNFTGALNAASCDSRPLNSQAGAADGTGAGAGAGVDQAMVSWGIALTGVAMGRTAGCMGCAGAAGVTGGVWVAQAINLKF